LGELKILSQMLRFVAYLSDLLPIIFFLLFKNRNIEKGLWVVFIYVFISFTIDNLFYLFSIPKNKEFYLFSIFTIIEYSLFSIFFYLYFKSVRFKQLIILGSFVFLVLAVYSLSKGINYRFDSLPASMESILIISYSILFFYEQLKSQENSFIYSTKKFWIVIAIFLYMAATFILFVSTAYMSEEERIVYWPINLIANITKNILLSIAFILKTEKNPASIQKTYNI
jgi:hypothetical protein